MKIYNEYEENYNAVLNLPAVKNRLNNNSNNIPNPNINIYNSNSGLGWGWDPWFGSNWGMGLGWGWNSWYGPNWGWGWNNFYIFIDLMSKNLLFLTYQQLSIL